MAKVGFEYCPLERHERSAASAYLSEDNSTIILSEVDIADTKIKLIVGTKRSVDAPEVSLAYEVGLN